MNKDRKRMNLEMNLTLLAEQQEFHALDDDLTHLVQEYGVGSSTSDELYEEELDLLYAAVKNPEIIIPSKKDSRKK